MLRLVILGDRIWGTSGYSKVVFTTALKLKELGHEIAHIPMGTSMRGGNMNYHGVLIYPSGVDSFGEDVAVPHYVDFKADMLITVKDVWAFNHIFQWAINWVPLCPVDHSPISPSITSRLHTAFKVISISRFGQRELRHNGIDSVYIPHGIPTDVYRPLNRKAECRKVWFLDPDAFVVGIVALNRMRKMIPHMLRGYKRFIELNPDVKTHLMLWTVVKPTRPTAEEEEVVVPGISDIRINLLPEMVNIGLIDPKHDYVHFPEERLAQEGIPEWLGETGGWDMVKLYNSFDALLLCSGGEGFGLPLYEAQSCGVPVITTDYAAGPEGVGAGLTVPAQDYIVASTPGTRYAIPSIDKMAEALTKIMNADPAKLAKRARRFAERYDWKIITEQYWKPFLQDAETELKPLIAKGGVKSWA